MKICIINPNIEVDHNNEWNINGKINMNLQLILK
jgi:hypothetical protein